MDRNVTPPEYAAEAESNEYYRTGFRIMARLVNIQVLIILALCLAFAFYTNTKKTHDRYFSETSDGRKTQLVALSFPNVGKVAIAGWVAQASSEIMTFGFNDLDTRFSLSKKNFTTEGWESFRNAVTKGGLIDDVIKLQQIVTTVPDSTPILLEEGVVNGNYRWVFDMPLLITFRAGGVKTSRPKVARITVERIPTRESPNGVGISEWYIR